MSGLFKDGLHLSKWVGAQLAKWREYLVLARSGRFGLREPERTLLASYLSRVSLLSLLERKNNFKRPRNKMSDHLNAMHARLAFLVEWCAPLGVVCSKHVSCVSIFYLLWQLWKKVMWRYLCECKTGVGTPVVSLWTWCRCRRVWKALKFAGGAPHT